MLDFEIPTDIDELMPSRNDDGKFKVKRLYKSSEIGQCLDGESPSIFPPPH